MLQMALKEWAVICDVLLAGEQALLVRKGGIAETGGPGRVQLEVPRFALFPAWLHQLPERIKPKWRDRVRVFDHEPAEILIQGCGVAEHVWRVPTRESLDALDDLHVWAPEQLDMRWNYKPHQPLFLLAVRVFRLAAPQTIANSPHYAGCKSWVDLEPADAIDDTGATPVLDDAQFKAIVSRVDAELSNF
jgi:hypothetical protein